MTQLVQILITLSTLSPFASAVHRAVEIHDFERPEVVRLYSLMPGIFKDIQSFKDEYNNWCTGVAISDSEVLTAGHCLFPDLSEVRLEPYYVQVSSSGGTKIVKAMNFITTYKREPFDYPYNPEIQYHPGYVKGCQKGPIPLFKTKESDLALVTFPKGTFSHWWEVDLKSPLKIGDEVEFWGYGVKFNSFVRAPMAPDLKSGALGRGSAVITQENDQRVAFELPAEGHWADSGDSGGPVLKDGRVVAILATRHEKCETPEGGDYVILNTATRLLSPENKILPSN